MKKTNLARRPVTAVTAVDDDGDEGGHVEGDAGSAPGTATSLGFSVIPRVWSMQARPDSASSSSRPSSQDSMRFFNISRGSHCDSGTLSRASAHAHAGSRPTSSAHTQRNRSSVSGPTMLGRSTKRASTSRAGLRTVAGQRVPKQGAQGYKYLRRRTASPGTLRHNEIKDALKLLMKKHKDEVLADEARLARQQQTERERADLSQDVVPCVNEQLDPNDVQRPPEPASSRHMAELSSQLKTSFRSSLEIVSTRENPLDHRLAGKKALESERSSLLRTLAAVRGQRYHLMQRLDEEEQERLAIKLAPVPSFRVETKRGEVAGGETVMSTGDVETWMESSLASKETALARLSDFSSTLAAHMPPLADMAEQRDKLLKVRQDLLEQLAARKDAQRKSFAEGSVEAHSEKLIQERDELRHSWRGRAICSGINTSRWYHEGDFEHTGAATLLLPRPANMPFRASYPQPPRAPVHQGETKALAQQGLSRFQLSGMLRDDKKSRGLVPALPCAISLRAAPHLQKVVSCVPASEHERRQILGKDPRLRLMIHTTATLDEDTGKVVDGARAGATSTVVSNSHSSVMRTNQWLKTQAAREWGATSVADVARHDVNCCCLACCMRHTSEHPAPHLLYQRLSTNEAGNSESYLRIDRGNGGPAPGTSPPTHTRHPQIPHGYLSPRTRRPLVAHTDTTAGPLCDKPMAQLQGQDFERKTVPFSVAIRGGPACTCLFSANIDGLIEKE